MVSVLGSGLRRSAADAPLFLGELRSQGDALGPPSFWVASASKSWRLFVPTNSCALARLALPKKAKGGGAALKLSAGNHPALHEHDRPGRSTTGGAVGG